MKVWCSSFVQKYEVSFLADFATDFCFCLCFDTYCVTNNFDSEIRTSGSGLRDILFLAISRAFIIDLPSVTAFVYLSMKPASSWYFFPLLTLSKNTVSLLQPTSYLFTLLRCARNWRLSSSGNLASKHLRSSDLLEPAGLSSTARVNWIKCV